MATEALKTMKEQLMNCVQGQLGDISKVRTADELCTRSAWRYFKSRRS